MQVRVLGRPALVGAGGVQELRGARQLGLLAVLTAHRGQRVGSDLLADELWAGRRVSESALRVTVSRLRSRFVTVAASDPITGGPRGYTLDLPADETDDGRFEALAASARAAWGRGDLVEARQRSAAAEALWAGPAYEGTDDLSSVRPRRARLEADRLDNHELGAAVRVAVGDLRGALAIVEELIALDPLRETAWGLRMVALHRDARPDDALAAAADLRAVLQTELGRDPGPVVTDLAADIAGGRPADEVEIPLLRPQVRSGSSRARPLPAAATLAPEAVPFVGREEVVSDLVALACGRSAAQVAVVEGPAGMGKSRLAQEVATAAWDLGTAVAWGTCLQDEAGDLVPVRSILGDLVDLLADPTHPDLAPIAEIVSDVDVGDADISSTLGADASTRRARLYTAIDHLTRAVRGPVLVVLDDAQWVNEGVRRLVAHLLVSAPDLRWLVAVRPTERADPCEALLGDLARRTATWHTLGPLEGHEVRDLVATEAPDRQADTWARLIEQRAGGNPFFVTELLRHLQAGGATDDRLPRSIEAVVRADLHRLGPDAATLIRVAAVAGSSHPLEVLSSVAGLDRVEAQQATHALVAAGLLRVDTAEIEADVAHDLARDAIAAQVDAPWRHHIHRELADALPPWGEHADELRLGHLLAAGPSADPEALDVAAAAVLRRLHVAAATEDAARIATAYLDTVGPRADTRSGVAVLALIVEALFDVGRVDDAERLQAEARIGAEVIGDPVVMADVALSRSPYAIFGEQVPIHLVPALAALERLPPQEWDRRLRLACWCGHLLVTSDRMAEAQRMVDVAEAALGTRTHPVMHSMVIGLRYLVAWAVDVAPEVARAAYGEAVDLAEVSNDLAATSTARMLALDQALRHGTIDDYEEAVVAVAETASRFSRTDTTWWAATSRAGVDLARGDLAASAVSLTRAADMGTSGGQQPGTPVALLQILLHLWDRDTLAVQRGMFGDHPSPEDETPYLLAQGLTCVESGDVDVAREVADAVAARRPVVPASGHVWGVCVSFGAEVAFRTGHRDLAAAVADAAAPHAGSGLSAAGFVYLGAADRALGLCAATLGDLDGAIDHLRTACEDDRRRGAPPWAARSATAAAEVLDLRGGPGDDTEAARFRGIAEELRPTV